MIRQVGFLAALAALAIGAVFVAPASSSRQLATLVHTCYPGNSFAVHPGNFSVSASGQGKGDIEIENTGTAADGEVTGAVGNYSFTGSVIGNSGSPFVPNGGQMNGSLSLSISWPSFPTTTFKAACIAELQTDPGTGTGSYETEIEGYVYNFPGLAPGPQRAIVSIHSEYDPAVPGLTYAVGIELGKTCNELPQFPGETELGGTIGGDNGLNSGSLHISPSGVTAGRAALPYGVTPSYSPGSPCDGSVFL